MPAPRKVWKAVVLAILTPGLGHLYDGRPRVAGLAFVACYAAWLGLAVARFGGPSMPGLVSALAASLAVPIGFVVHAGLTARRAPVPFPSKRYDRWWVYLAAILVVLFVWQPAVTRLVRADLVQAYRIPSASMEPTLLTGDYLLVDRRASARRMPARDQVIVFASLTEPGVDVIKRVAGLPGDTLAMVAGRLIRNGVAVEEPWVAPVDSARAFEAPEFRASQLPHLVRDPEGYRPTMLDWGPLVVPAESLFVLGDNRLNAYDSRFWGAAPAASVVGLPVSIYLSVDRRNGFGVRWDRIGTKPWVVVGR